LLGRVAESTRVMVRSAPAEKLGGSAVLVAAEGSHTLLHRSTDVAVNQEQQQALKLNLDLTPPEATLALDRASRDMVVIGVDTGSGVPTGNVQPASVRAATAAEARAAGLDDDAIEDAHLELRTYRVVDSGGNSVTLQVVVSSTSRSVRAGIVSLPRLRVDLSPTACARTFSSQATSSNACASARSMIGRSFRRCTVPPRTRRGCRTVFSPGSSA
jgi:hypothetical protein